MVSQSGSEERGEVKNLEDTRDTMSLRDLYAPVREQIAESGITEEELDVLLEEAREEVWQEKQGDAPL